MNPFPIRLLFVSIFFLAVRELGIAQNSQDSKTIFIFKKNSGSLSGKVVEKNSHSPLPGATISIPDLKLGVLADTAGNYHFNSLPSGTYLVQVHYVGFKTVTRNVSVNGSTVEDFELSDNTIEESPVGETGFSNATQIRRSP